MPTDLRIMSWNIAEGWVDRKLPENGALPRIAQHINNKSPDIVLLNEVRNWHWPSGGGVNQVKEIARLTGFQYCHWGKTVLTGLAGYKAIAVLSKLPLGEPKVHPVMRGSQSTTYAILETSTSVNGIELILFSLRFDAHNSDDNVAGFQQLKNIVYQHPNSSIIIGGDFNAGPDTPQMVDFLNTSGLKDTFLEHPDPQVCAHPTENPRIDYIFYRGPYQVALMEQRCPWDETNEPSDHPWVVTDLLYQQPAPSPVKRLTVSITPYPVPINKSVTVTVHAVDPETGASVSGNVKINGTIVSSTDVPFTYTFKKVSRTIWPTPGRPQRIEELPRGIVVANGYPDTPIKFGFSGG